MLGIVGPDPARSPQIPPRRRAVRRQSQSSTAGDSVGSVHTLPSPPPSSRQSPVPYDGPPPEPAALAEPGFMHAGPWLSPAVTSGQVSPPPDLVTSTAFMGLLTAPLSPPTPVATHANGLNGLEQSPHPALALLHSPHPALVLRPPDSPTLEPPAVVPALHLPPLAPDSFVSLPSEADVSMEDGLSLSDLCLDDAGPALAELPLTMAPLDAQLTATSPGHAAATPLGSIRPGQRNLVVSVQVGDAGDRC